jgi:hypothetical protein
MSTYRISLINQQFSFTKGHGIIPGKRGEMFSGHGPGVNE